MSSINYSYLNHGETSGRECTPYVAACTLSGERARRRSTTPGMIAMAQSISSAVVGRPRLKRRLERASSGESPIAEQHVRRLDRAGRTGRAGGARNSLQVERDHQRFAARAAKRQVAKCWERGAARSPFTRTPGIRRAKPSSRLVAKRAMRAASVRQMLARELRGFAQADDAGNIFRAGAAVAFVMPAMKIAARAACRCERRERPRPSARKFCARKSKANPRRGGSRPAAICRRTAPRRNESRRPLPRRCAPISSIGWIVPSSLFACITLISTVSGRSAARMSRDRRCRSWPTGT